MDWTRMFLRLMTLLSYGTPLDEAVDTVADTTPDATRTEAYFAAIAAQAHLEREAGSRRHNAKRAREQDEVYDYNHRPST